MKDFSGTILIAKNDKILLRKSFGAANYELSVPNKPQTKFQIASLSKTFTAAAIVLLEKNGHLRLDEALSKLLPDFPNGDRIKISHLLSLDLRKPGSLAGFLLDETEVLRKRKP